MVHKPWDGPVDLYDMFQLAGKRERILKKYDNLGENLSELKSILLMQNDWKMLKKFSNDLQVILTMLRYRDSKEELTDYINENK